MEGTATGPEVHVGAREMTDQGRDIRTRDPGDARGITGHGDVRSHSGANGSKGQG